MKVSLWQISVIFIAFSLLLPVDCGKIKGGAGGVANVGKAIGRSGVGGKKGIGKAAKTAAVVVGSGAAGYIAYKGIKHAVKHRHGDDSSEEYDDYRRSRNYGYASAGIRTTSWSPTFLIFPVIALKAIRWY